MMKSKPETGEYTARMTTASRRGITRWASREVDGLALWCCVLAAKALFGGDRFRFEKLRAVANDHLDPGIDNENP